MKSQQLKPDWKLAAENYDIIKQKCGVNADELAHKIGWVGRQTKARRFKPGAWWKVEELLKLSEVSGVSVNDIFTKKLSLTIGNDRRTT